MILTLCGFYLIVGGLFGMWATWIAFQAREETRVIVGAALLAVVLWPVCLAVCFLGRTA